MLIVNILCFTGFDGWFVVNDVVMMKSKVSSDKINKTRNDLLTKD